MAGVEFRLTSQGRTAPIVSSPEGKILEYMQTMKQGVINEHQVRYELQIYNAHEALENLEKGGYIQKRGPGLL